MYLFAPGGIIPAMYYLYIVTNRSKTLYTGVTSELEGRVWEHKNKVNEGFSSRYRIDRLVFYEEFGRIEAAIAREKQIKGWRRMKKIALIVATNPTWRDLSDDWGKVEIPAWAKKPNT
jgi:putative endonuclease